MTKFRPLQMETETCSSLFSPPSFLSFSPLEVSPLPQVVQVSSGSFPVDTSAGPVSVFLYPLPATTIGPEEKVVLSKASPDDNALVLQGVNCLIDGGEMALFGTRPEQRVLTLRTDGSNWYSLC